MDFTLYVERLLTDLSGDPGCHQIKSLLMDADLLKVVSTTCLQSALLKHGYLLFETLGQSGGHAPLGFVTCVVLLQPVKGNIRLLGQELQSPRFGNYLVYFSSPPDTLTLRELAELDTHCLIQSVEEIPLQFLPLEPNVFTRLSWDPSPDPQLSEAAHAIASVWQSLGLRQAVVAHVRGSEDTANLSRLVSRLLPSPAQDGPGDGVVLLLDRNADLVTPLLTRWTYQAMIHELLGIQRNVVKLEDPAGTKPAEQIILSSKYDDFFQHNMFKNFGEIGEVVKKLVKEFQDKVSGHKNIESIGDIKDFIVTYPQFKKISGTVSKHVNIISELSRLVNARKLLHVSEIEQTQAGGASDQGPKELDDALNDPEILPADKLRLFLLSYLKHGCRTATNSPATFRKHMLDPEISQSAAGLKILANRVQNHLGYRQSEAGTSKVKHDDNLYTQHKSAAFWLVESILQGRWFEEIVLASGPKRPGNTNRAPKKILVYILGGFTYEESLKIYQLNCAYRSNIVIGGCTLWKSDDFCRHLKSLSTR